MTFLAAPTYQVSLAVFEGPLDLLLHLIEREELDITTVSLAQVTNQYLDHLAQISDRNPDNLADFLVVAAKLLLIKSRVLLPQPAAASSKEQEADVGDDLVRQLVEYKRFKEVAQWLEEIEGQGQRSYVRVAPPPQVERVVDLGDVTLGDLLDAMRQVLAVKPPAASVNNTVAPITITIAEQIDLIMQETTKRRTVSFRRLLVRATSRLEVIVTLLALLELVKQLHVTIHQSQPFDDILIVRKEAKDPKHEHE
ncbi:MAG: segregation/condensation protein A [Anaerolineae bacterium]|jgi:segregation and condensation protein A